MKSGYKTSEFWVTAFTIIGAGLEGMAGKLPAEYATIAASVASAGYAVSRALTKMSVATPTTPDTTTPDA